jgi:hypothetical protein
MAMDRATGIIAIRVTRSIGYSIRLIKTKRYENVVAFSDRYL